MVTMEPGYLFLGSRLGNSLLLKYTEKLQETPTSVAKDASEKLVSCTICFCPPGWYMPPGWRWVEGKEHLEPAT